MMTIMCRATASGGRETGFLGFDRSASGIPSGAL
jgi:hypothetical protein